MRLVDLLRTPRFSRLEEALEVMAPAEAARLWAGVLLAPYVLRVVEEKNRALEAWENEGGALAPEGP